MYLWNVDSRIEPEIRNYPHDAWEASIIDAYQASLYTTRDIQRIQVVDAWGMLIVQFTSRWMYDGKTA